MQILRVLLNCSWCVLSVCFFPKVYCLINLFIFDSEACKILVPQSELEPRSPAVEVKWALGSITINKASGGDRIPAERLQILKDGTIKANLENSQWPWDWKRTVFILTPNKGYAKGCSNYCTNVLISYTSKVMLKILQYRLQQYILSATIAYAVSLIFYLINEHCSASSWNISEHTWGKCSLCRVLKSHWTIAVPFLNESKWSRKSSVKIRTRI